MPSRVACKKSLAPAVTTNWLIIMASVAGIAMNVAGAKAADEPDTASTQSKWSIVIGGGGAYAPDYEGSDDYEFQPFPFASIVYDDFIFVEGTSLGANLLNYEGLKAGPIVRYSGGRDEDDNNALDGLGDVDDSIEVGGFVGYELGIWSAALTVTQDVAGGHEGMLAEMSTGVAVPLSETVSSSIEASATWADSNYMDAFFGVSGAQALKSGYARHEADAGFKDVGIAVGLNYMLTETITVSGRAQYKKLLGDAADSPIVKDEGSDDQFFTGMFLTYKWR
jgi:outer membrane protein